VTRLTRAELPVDTAALARFLIGKVVVRETPDGVISGGSSRPRPTSWATRPGTPFGA
jgi:hypothetical protein